MYSTLYHEQYSFMQVVIVYYHSVVVSMVRMEEGGAQDFFQTEITCTCMYI